jgi:phosphatidylserine/phosphatidylglycerophosphate/cardiolipin synthase-like enzyme
MHPHLLFLFLAGVVLTLSAIVACHPSPSNAASSDRSLPGSLSLYVEPDGSGVAAPLLSAMEAARASVHVEMYLLTSHTYVDALCALYAAGVDVKVVLNERFPPGTDASATNDAAYATLSAMGVPVAWAPTTTGFPSYTHAKTVVIDAETGAGEAWIMTMNLDTSAFTANREYLVRDRAPEDVAEAEAIFEADFAAVPLMPEGSLVVAPSPENDAASTLLALVESARATLDIEAEELTALGVEARIFAALVDKAESGVTVRVVLEDSTDEEQASAVAAVRAAGASVRGYSYGHGKDIHAKAIVADGARAFVGSENLSGGSLGENREIGIVFSEEAWVSLLDSTILEDFAGAGAYLTR